MQLPFAPAERSTPTLIERVAPVSAVTAAARPQSFVDTLRKIWRHRGMVLTCALVVGSASAVAAIAIRPYYTAEAQVLIGVPEPRVFSNEQLFDPLPPDTEKVENERVVMLSRDHAREVVGRLNLANDPEFAPRQDGLLPNWQRFLPASRFLARFVGTSPRPADPMPTERIIDALLSHVWVTRMGRSQVLAIDANAGRADLAASIANTWADVFLKSQRGEKVETTNRIESYLSDRIAELRQKVQTSDQAVEDYRRQYGLYRGTNAGITSQQLTELNTQLTLAQTQKVEADAKLREALALQHDGGSDPNVLDSRMIQTLKQQQAETEQRLAQLESTFGDRYPTVVKAKAEAADIRQKLDAEVARTIDGVRRAAQTADMRYDTLNHDFLNLKSQMGEVNDKDIHLEALERDATVNRNLLEAMLNRAGQTIGREVLEQPDAKLVSGASPPAAPDFPPKKLIVLLGTLGGVLLGTLAALMRENTDSTFHSADDILAATGLPLIASVPLVPGRQPPASHVLQHPVSPFSEALRKIYIGTLLAAVRQPPKTILVSSSVPDEGKSVLTAALGRLLARSGKRVLVIDCDWRSPTLHRIFRCSNRTGLASLMIDDEPRLADLIHNDTASGVDVLAAGNWTPQMAHRMASERMARIVRTFAANYDLVILDGPPVLAGPEALPLARIADKTLFVVRWGHTRREPVLDALRQLADAQVDLAGAVFARVDPKRYRQFTQTNLNYEYVRAAFT